MRTGQTLRVVRREPAGTPHGWPGHVHPVLQRVCAARGVLCPEEIGHRLDGLLPPDGLGDIDRAVSLLAEAIANDSRIVIAGDYDCDGATGCAVAVRGLRMLGARNVGYAVPNRSVHGYGLSSELVATMRPAPDLIVTVDNGIASLAGVAAAKARGCKVIVTDHHLPGDRLPDADAIVDPVLVRASPDQVRGRLCARQSKSGNPLPHFSTTAATASALRNLAGVGVMFYLLLALRAGLGKRTTADLAQLLDLVALGTVADLVSLDRNNRALVEGGLCRIRSGRACEGIASLLEISGRDPRNATSADLGYAVGPRINAAGRLEDISIGVECLLADDPGHARELAGTLHAINAGRRDLQASMVDDASVMLDGVDAGDAVGVALFDPAWHAGVVGLVASKVKERLHRPAVAFAPAGEDSDSLRGSARSIPGFHIRDALAEVDARCPGLIERFGGHAMAAGLTLRQSDYVRFAETFDAVARERIAPESLQPVLHSDGELVPSDFDIELARQLRAAGPWGQGFPPPLFDNVFECGGCRPMGVDGLHLRLQLRDPRDGCVHDAVWFHTDKEIPQNIPLCIVYELAVNEWQGRESLRLLVRHVEPA